MNILIQQLLDEHRETSKVLGRTRELALQLSSVSALEASAGELLSLLESLRKPVETQHHSNEELLYKALKETNVSMHSSCRQIAADHGAFHRIQSNLCAHLKASASHSPEELRALIMDYLDNHNQHMDCEENFLFPLAEKHLTENHWGKIESEWLNCNVERE